MSEKGFSKLVSLEKYPLCGGDLEEGYMLGPRGIYWDTRSHQFSIIGAEALKSQWAWTMPRSPALRCKSCRIAVLDYGKLRETPKSF